MHKQNTAYSKRRIVVIIGVVTVLGIVGYASIFMFLQGSEWRFEAGEWEAARNAPMCEDPLSIASPMDMKKATSKLYPGQVRGTDFKPHGGLAIDDAQNTQVDVYAVRNAKFVQAARYKENGVEQYLLDFIDSCGVMFRYDHIAKVAPQLAKYADQLELKDNDSKTFRIDGPMVKRGDIIATEVGQAGNVGFDLGVYDLRRQNEASKTAVYQTDQRRIGDKEQSFYAVCWFDLLPPIDRELVGLLPSRSNNQEGTSSDYCPTH